MLFRPLCIDYRTRAQEVLAVESAAEARRAALCLLPHRIRPPSRHDEGPSAQGDDAGFQAHCDDFQADTLDTCVTSPSSSHTVDEGIRNDRSPAELNSSIFQKLGPAVHPSECALRKISPVTKGPIRNRLLKIEHSKPVLRELVESHERIMQEKMMAVVSSLESGRSRFTCGMSDNYPHPFGSDDDSRDGEVRRSIFKTGQPRGDLFYQTMVELYSRNGYLCDPFDATTVSDNAVIDSTNETTPSPKSLFLRHESPDLSKIRRLKSLRASNAVSYADSLSTMFQPELKSLYSRASSRSLTDSGISHQSDSSGREDILCSQPKFDITNMCGAESRTVDYSSRNELVPFTDFFQDDNEDDSPTNASEKSQRRYMCKALAAMDTIGYFIRMDPDIPVIDEIPKFVESAFFHAELNKSLDVLCGSTSILAKLKLPTRFETGHDRVQHTSRFFVTLERSQFKFLNDAMTQFKNSVAECPSSFETCLKLIESLYVDVSHYFVPRQISLESSVLLFEESTSESELEASANRNELISRLPDFSSMISFSHKFQEKGKTNQTRHVISSARVSEASALKDVIGSNVTPCLFLPQINIRSPSTSSGNFVRKRRPIEDDTIAHVVRLCVPSDSARRNVKPPDELNSRYPIEHWFSSDGTGLHPSRGNDTDKDCMSGLQKEINRERRIRFCENAQARGREEKLRTLIETGCSARTNVGGVLSYRGFLTNQIVDPKAYQFRYASMLEMKKALRLKIDSKSLKTFVCMSQDILVAALLRGNESGRPKGKNKRGALLANRLNTKRHHSLALVQENKSERTQDKTQQFLKFPYLESLASMTKHCSDVLPDNVMEKLGQTLKEERGELLHLVSKAHQLEKEERAYREELTVLTRRNKNAKHDLFEEELCDIVVGPDGGQDRIYESHGKRKDPTDFLEKELDEKKKRKRDKRKNETAEERAERKAAKKKHKRKEHRKRKSKHDSSADDHHNVLHRPMKGEMCNVEQDETSTAKKETHDSSTWASARNNVRVAGISVPLGITPIVHPVKKTDHQESFVDSNKSAETYRATLINRESINSVAATQKIKDSTLSCLSKTNSPDSVASLNEGRKLLFSVKKSESGDSHLCTPREIDNIDYYKNDWSEGKVLDRSELFCSRANDHRFDNYSNESSQESLEAMVVDEKDSAVLKLDQKDNENQDSLNEVYAKNDSIALLSGEHFLENFPETIAELASGRWVKFLAPGETLKVSKLANKQISIVDCPLVDCAGVDIEIPDGKGVIVHRLTSWFEDNQNVQKGSRAFIRKLVLLAASGRYNYLHVILCVDNDFTSTLSNEVVTLQNALVQQSGCHMTFEFVTLRILSASLALLLVSNSIHDTNIADLVSDEDTVERARFLINLVPSMPVHVALKCLGCSGTQSSQEHPGKALYNIFCWAKTLRREDFLLKTSTILPEISAHQMWLALHVDISHAH
ncbi:hypothetical protein HJC23_004842 [Cyclotella cryptica]|uniref:Uncharacterized protein n=1 Tax=Cyclotella cryptica TaxID=29204 RepID=A0ABD3P2S5_9STRA|eukprot:CCRYP_018297-RA/>CCRYP_018297-RA protein AED:0.05 eAED:0.05 QI:0/-1/0/1/-1/1/1/0/1447